MIHIRKFSDFLNLKKRSFKFLIAILKHYRILHHRSAMKILTFYTSYNISIALVYNTTIMVCQTKLKVP